MTDSAYESPEPRADVVSALRALANNGAPLREMVAEVRTRLGYKDEVFLPVMWYFMKAFSLRLPDVLPMREWLFGTLEDDEVSAVIQSRIANARGKWSALNNGSAHEGATGMTGDLGHSTAKQGG